MALTVNFWSYSKRANSTARPSGTPARSLSCVLKSDSGVLSPVLEIGLGMSFNPSGLNYAQIPSYSRYYRVTDWQWSGGLWLCSLEVDALGSWKTEIGASTMYVVRAAAEYDAGIVDTLYPTRYGPRVMFHDQVDFAFDQDLSGAGASSTYTGCYIVGIAANSNGYSSYYTGPVTYWVMGAGQCRHFVDYMLMSYGQAWNQSPTALAELIYRAAYDPFSYIKSCMWFPLSPPLTANQYITFGSYVSDQQAMRLDPESTNWTTVTRDLDLPTGWATMEARDLCQPYAHLYLVFNPWGVIELNPTDFFGAYGIRLVIYPDFVSGDCMLKIYALQLGGLVFVTERNAKIGVNVNLSSSTLSLTGLIGGAATTASGIASAAAASGGAAIAAGALIAAGGATSAVASLLPSPGSSVGQQSGGVRAMEGKADLYYWQSYFADRDNADHGRPLYKNRQLSTLPGYIKVGDSHIQIPGFAEEITAIDDYLEGGFFYE